MEQLKKVFFVTILLIVLVITCVSYSSTKKHFLEQRAELEGCIEFARLRGMIDSYFTLNGEYPRTLLDVDSVFGEKVHFVNMDQLRNSSYRFLVDPFSGNFLQYLPIMDSISEKAIGFYVLSAGIDGRVDNTEVGESMKLYDTLEFSIYDHFFGNEDLVIAKGSINDWISAEGFNSSFNDLVSRYNIDKRKDSALYWMFNFKAIVDSVSDGKVFVREIEGDKRAVCSMFPFEKSVIAEKGDTVNLKGIYNNVELYPDTVLTFIVCSVLDRK